LIVSWDTFPIAQVIASPKQVFSIADSLQSARNLSELTSLVFVLVAKPPSFVAILG